MIRTIPILVGLIILLAAGVGHGLWADRWLPSEELEQADAFVASLPTEFGAWTSEPNQFQGTLAQAGATSAYSRIFTDPETGEKVTVILLAGRANRMVVHRPEHCYQSDGYQIDGAARRYQLDPVGMPSCEFFTALFSREEAMGLNQLRIFWSFAKPAERVWEAPNNPRLHYVREKVLFKLYVFRSATGSKSMAHDPCVRLMRLLLPIIHEKQ